MTRSRRFHTIFAVSLFLVSFIHASFAEELSQPVYDVAEMIDVKVEMRDGVRLSTNIFRPDAEGAFPAILQRSPYGNGGPGNGTGRYYASRGYVVVLQDCRGRYESEGVFDPLRNEARDGFDAQQWVAAQPWCNGRIGTMGGSYVGFTQWLPARFDRPNVVAMIPVLTVSDLYEDWAYHGGAFRLNSWSRWNFEMTLPFSYNTTYTDGVINSINLHLPVCEQDVLLGWRVPGFRDWSVHPEYDAYWRETSVRGRYDTIDAAVLNIGGWFDIFLGGTIRNYCYMTDASIDPSIRKKQKLIIGPWLHGISQDGKTGEMDYGADGGFPYQDRNTMHLQWFDTYLKDMETDIDDEPPVKLFVMGDNAWRFENEWPLARTEYTPYYFHSDGNANSVSGDGTLSTRAPSGDADDRFVYNPADPVPSPMVAGVGFPVLGPVDQQSVETRDDLLVYSTPPLEKDTEVTGPVEVILYAASTAVTTDFTAKLCDVFPDGRSIRLCDGVIRATHRNGNSGISFIEPGTIYEYRIDLVATGNVFKKGHRIRVEISSSNFPRFDRNLNTSLNNALAKEMVKAEQTVYHNETYPSHIVLPVIPR